MEISFFYQRVYKEISHSVLMYISKNVTFLSPCSSFSSNSPTYMHLKDFENCSSAFIAQRSSMDRVVASYLYALVDFLEITFHLCLD